MAKNQMILADSDELREIVIDAVSETLKSELPRLIRSSKAQKDWLTKKEVMQLTGWSSRTLQYMRDSKQIPFSQHGHKILYPTDGIEQFLKEHYVKPRTKE